MPRLRLGVALLVPPPVAHEVDVLRRACGDDEPARVAPHLTLVPPVNVREDRLDDALEVLRSGAGRTRPITVTLGPLTTFLPVNPVLYLGVGGEVEAVRALRHRMFVEPLARSLTWPFHPHVTVLDGGEPDRLDAAVTALAGYRVEITFDRVHLLEEVRDEDGRRVWRPLADATFGAPAVVGRGGLELELATTEQLDPDAGAFRLQEWAVADHQPSDAGRQSLVVTARRAGKVVGTARGWTIARGAHLPDVMVAATHRREGIGAHLVAAFTSAASARGCASVRTRCPAEAPAMSFWRRLGWTEETRFEGEVPGSVMVQLRRDL